MKKNSPRGEDNEKMSPQQGSPKNSIKSQSTQMANPTVKPKTSPRRQYDPTTKKISFYNYDGNGSNMKKFNKPFECNKCKQRGHVSKDCKEPTISYGIILFKIDGISENELRDIIFADLWDSSLKSKCKIELRQVNTNLSLGIENQTDLEYFDKYKNKIKFLLGTRKYSFEIFEFMLGKYNERNNSELVKIFEGMLPEEISLVGNNLSEEGFENLWEYVWTNKDRNHQDGVKKKFLNIVKGVDMKLKNEKNEEIIVHRNLKYYVDNIKPKYISPEKTLFKGRIKKDEDSDIIAATRETNEETGIDVSNYLLFNKICPINENFEVPPIREGEAPKNFRSTYFIGCVLPTSKIDLNGYSKTEFKKIEWFTQESANDQIRTDHSARKEVILRAFYFIMNRLLKHKPKLNENLTNSQHNSVLVNKQNSKPPKIPGKPPTLDTFIRDSNENFKNPDNKSSPKSFITKGTGNPPKGFNNSSNLTTTQFASMPEIDFSLQKNMENTLQKSFSGSADNSPKSNEDSTNNSKDNSQTHISIKKDILCSNIKGRNSFKKNQSGNTIPSPIKKFSPNSSPSVKPQKASPNLNITTMEL